MSDVTGISEHEVRAAFEDAIAAPPAHTGRLAEVEGRVRRVRRRRSAVAASLAALGVVASGVLVAHGVARAPAPTTATGPELPQYRSGGKLVASAVSHDASGIALTFTPTSLDLQVFTGCAAGGSASVPAGDATGPGRLDMTVQITVNGNELGGGFCETGTTTASLASSVRPGSWAALGVRVGQPVTIGYSAAPGQSPHAVAWAMAVYQDVPVESYVFPPAPSPLPTLGPEGSIQQPDAAPILVVRGEGTPAQPSSLTAVTLRRDASITLHHGLLLQFAAAVPGDLEVTVNGVVIWTPKSWTYGVEGAESTWTLADLGLKPGESAKITVTAHRYLGATWQLAAYDVTS